MLNPESIVPAIDATNGMPMAVIIAVSITAIVALGMGVWSLRRNARLTRLAGGVSAVIALGILVGALVMGGSLTRPPTAAAVEDQAPRGATTAPIELKLSGLQLPTL